MRLKCPADSPHCRHQPPVPVGDGCAKKDLAFWFSNKMLHVKPETPRQKLAKPLTHGGPAGGLSAGARRTGQKYQPAADAK